MLQSKRSAWFFPSSAAAERPEVPYREAMFVGEAFDGEAGALFDKILGAIGLSRQTVHVTVLSASLDEQIAVVGPKVIVALGEAAARALLGEASLGQVRGQWGSYTPRGAAAVKVLPTFHPAALLRDPLKRDVWTDMKNLKNELES